jgi:hypothetical protein
MKTYITIGLIMILIVLAGAYEHVSKVEERATDFANGCGVGLIVAFRMMKPSPNYEEVSKGVDVCYKEADKIRKERLF